MHHFSGRQLLRFALISLQWLCLTFALGAILARTEDSLQGLLGGQIGVTYLFIAGLVAGILMGISIPSARVLFPVTFAMCAGAATIYVALLFAPTWEGITVRSGALETFATTRAILYGGLLLVPTWLGSLGGYLVSASAGRHGEILRPESDARREPDAPSWWERRRN